MVSGLSTCRPPGLPSTLFRAACAGRLALHPSGSSAELFLWLCPSTRNFSATSFPLPCERDPGAPAPVFGQFASLRSGLKKPIGQCARSRGSGSSLRPLLRSSCSGAGALQLALSSGQLSCSFSLLPTTGNFSVFSFPLPCERDPGAPAPVFGQIAALRSGLKKPIGQCARSRGSGKDVASPLFALESAGWSPFVVAQQPRNYQLPSSLLQLKETQGRLPLCSARVRYARFTPVVRNPMGGVLVSEGRKEVLRTTCSWRHPARCTLPFPG